MVNAVTLTNTICEYAPKLARSIVKGPARVKIGVVQAEAITRNPQIVTDFGMTLRECIMTKRPEFMRTLYKREVPPVESALGKVLKQFVAFANQFKNSDATLTITREASKQTKGATIVRAAVNNGNKDVIKVAVKVSGTEAAPTIKIGANAMGISHHLEQVVEPKSAALPRAAKKLGVEPEIALQRSIKAQAAGVDTRKPELMERAILGEFDKGPAIRGNILKVEAKPQVDGPQSILRKEVHYTYPKSVVRDVIIPNLVV